MSLLKYFETGDDKVTKENNPGREDWARNWDDAWLLCSYVEGQVEKKESGKQIGKDRRQVNSMPQTTEFPL